MTEQTLGKIESLPKLEWGLDLGKISWYEAQVKIAEMNANLVEGEEKWRLPTKDELIDALKRQYKEGENLGFHSGCGFLSNTDGSEDEEVWCVFFDMHGLGSEITRKGSHYEAVRLVRDAA